MRCANMNAWPTSDLSCDERTSSLTLNPGLKRVAFRCANHGLQHLWLPGFGLSKLFTASALCSSWFGDFTVSGSQGFGVDMQGQHQDYRFRQTLDTLHAVTAGIDLTGKLEGVQGHPLTTSPTPHLPFPDGMEGHCTIMPQEAWFTGCKTRNPAASQA